ncbi:hypothetical protein CCP3SC5AM1_570017 [Gammaproteobacteria bacterium]
MWILFIHNFFFALKGRIVHRNEPLWTNKLEKIFWHLFCKRSHLSLFTHWLLYC